MPRLHVPSKLSKKATRHPVRGLLSSNKRGSGASRRPAMEGSRKKDQDEFIVADLLRFDQDQEGNSNFAAKRVVVKNKATKKKNRPQAPKVTPLQQRATKPWATMTTSAPSSSSTPLSNRRALAIDTRILQTVTGDAAGRVFLHHVDTFLASLKQRGATPCIVASLREGSTAPGSGSRKQSMKGRFNSRTAPIEAKALPLTGKENVEHEWKDLLQHPVHIQAPSNAGNIKNREAVHVPNKLLARSSYKFFGNLLESAVQMDAETYDQIRPLDITILTNDIAFLSDTNNDSHKDGLDDFWNQLRTIHSRKRDAVGSVTIVVVETGGGLDACAASESAGTHWNDNVSTAAQHRLDIRQCVRFVKNELRFKSNSKQVFDSRPEDMFVSVPVDITTLENNKVAFHTLASKWTTDMAMPTSQKGRRITFSLPETVDGTQCGVNLDLCYKIMPFRLDSSAVAQLRMDMELLSRSEIRVLQVVPLASVDASLLFGVPMCVKAGMERDLSRFREMNLLVRCLWNYLVQQQVALVLRAENRYPEQDCSPLYHEEEQTFLLMTEESPRKPSSDFNNDNDGKPEMGGTCGVLFRYACKAQLLFRGGDDDFMDPTQEEDVQQYADYIENSLEFLNSEAINPLLVGMVEDEVHGGNDFQDATSKNTETLEKDVTIPDLHDIDWTDDCGVGARASEEASSGEESDDYTNKFGEDEFQYE